MPEAVEKLVRRCPRLGHDIPLAYCLEAHADGTICPKVLDCWWEIFDVAAWLKSRLSPEDWHKLCCEPPAPKLVSLLEQIEQARVRVQDAT